MKKILKLILLTTIAGFAVWACKDSFSEEDFIKSQLDLKAKQDSITLSKMNQAGKLLSYTVQVLEDKVPVADVTVTMSNPPAGSTSPVTGATDANGFATFSDVQMGSNTFIISKTGYYPATFIVDFGKPQNGTNYTIVNNTVVPIKVNASAQVPIFANGGSGETAVIKGKVTIETDLTNTTPEIPQNLTLKANIVGVNGFLGGNANATSSGGIGLIQTYFFNTNSIGTADVDNTTGAYSMTVPASADGRQYTMIYPVITADQKVGYNKLNGTTISPTISSTVPAVYGPNGLAPFYDPVPSVSGVVATFNPSLPATPGQGLKFIFTAIPIGLGTGFVFNYNSSTLSNNSVVLTRGSGYTSSPAITVNTPAGGTAATANCALMGVVTGLNINTPGTGYTGTVVLNLQQSNDGGTNYFQSLDILGNPVTWSKDVGSTPTDLSGLSLPATITNLAGLDPARPFMTSLNAGGFGVTNFRLVLSGGGTGTGASVAPVINGRVENINVLTSGSGYTDENLPVFTFTGGSGSGAALVINEFETQWNIAIDNSGNTQPYNVLPLGISFVFSKLSGILSSNLVLDQFNNATFGFVGSNFNQLVTVSGGNVVQLDLSKQYKTSIFSAKPPSAVVTPSFSAPPVASVNIVNNTSASNYGQISTLTVSNTGSGYEAPISISISPVTGLSGSSGRIDLSPHITFNSVAKSYQWSGLYTIANRGSNYQPFINMYYSYYGLVAGSTSAIQFSGNTGAISVKSGETILNDVRYGTGSKQLIIN